jgi:predicted methyltransferase
MKFLFLAVTLLSACASSSSHQQSKITPAPHALPPSLAAAVDSPFRSPENKLRDGARHPKQTLEFFGIKPGFTVVEISPSAGWYTEILAPYLTAHGKYIAAQPPGGSEYMDKMLAKFGENLARMPEVKVERYTFNPPTELNIAPEGSADMVLTFRNVHNWASKGNEHAAFQAFFKALKPGGILGVVEHRADAKSKKDPKFTSGYIREADVIKMAEKAGFTFEARSDINANPKDTKDYPNGVWTLPPVLRDGEKDREKYVAIGESDRMTLKFVKPDPAAKKSKK